MTHLTRRRFTVRFPLRRPRRSARLRLTALYGTLFLASGVVLVAVTYGLFQRATEYTTPHLPQIPNAPSIQGLQLITPSSLSLRANPPNLVISQLAYDQGHLAQTQHQLQITLALNQPLGMARPQLGPLVTQLSQDQQKLTQDQQNLTQDQHQLTQAVDQLSQAVHQVAQAGVVQSAQRASDSHELLVNSALALALVAVLAIVAGWLVAGRMLRPIRTITRTARRISSTNLHERLALDGPPDELKLLGDTLDELLGRLEAAFDAQRHFVANASHELRTPVTAERNLLQVALDDPTTSAEEWRSTARDLLASNDEQKHLIEALLALASSESGLDHHERTDLADICRTVLARPQPDTSPAGLHGQAAIRPAPLDGDPKLIERLVANLVDNATAHNIAGGHVHVSTHTDDNRAVLTVTNTGPVIPPADMDRLFQPFQRLDPRRTHHKNGHGLGLSIVHAIATTHHATITAHPQLEGGLTVTVTFPPPTDPETSHERMPRRLAASPS